MGAPTPSELAQDLRLQLTDMLHEKGERGGMVEMKKFAAWALKGFVGAATLRKNVMTIDSVRGMNEMLDTVASLSHLGDEPSGESA